MSRRIRQRLMTWLILMGWGAGAWVCAASPASATDACGIQPKPGPHLSDAEVSEASLRPQMIEQAVVRGMKIIDQEIQRCLATMSRTSSEQRRHQIAKTVAQLYVERLRLQQMLRLMDKPGGASRGHRQLPATAINSAAAPQRSTNQAAAGATYVTIGRRPVLPRAADRFDHRGTPRRTRWTWPPPAPQSGC